jgi:tRNA pseudouridine38-40 synthase
MPRYKLVVEYDGTPFVGWQRQINGRSVQQALEEAVEPLPARPVRLQCAGRTRPPGSTHPPGRALRSGPCVEGRHGARRRPTAHLRPEPIVVLRAETAPADFNAELRR